MKFPQLSIKLDTRSRFILSVMVVLLAAVIYYRNIYLPRASRVRDFKERYLALKAEEDRLNSSMPNVEEEQKRLDALSENYDSLTAKIKEVERIVPKNTHIPDILDLLVREKGKFNMEIINITCRTEKMQDVPLWTPPPDSKQKPVSYYAFLPIDIEAYCSFNDIVGYIEGLENKLPYQSIGGLQMNMQKTSGGRPQCFLSVRSLLGRGQEEDEGFDKFKAALAEAKAIIGSFDPFFKSERPRIEERLAGVQLDGIISKKGRPCAIINNATYGIGDIFEGKKIVKIEDNTVTLEGENRLFKLEIKGEY